MANSTDWSGNAQNVVKFARLIHKTYGRNSLTRSARDTIAYFPVIFSGDIPADDSVIIAKALEAQYAALLVSVISANSDFDRSVYPNATDYIKTFHNNSAYPSFLRAIDSQLPEGTTRFDCVVESASTLYDLEKLVDPDLVVESTLPSERFNSSTLNHSYRPEYATQKAMESVVQNLRALHTPAMEDATDDLLGSLGAPANEPRVTKDGLGAPTKAEKVSKTTLRGVPLYDENNKPIIDPKTGKQMTGDKIIDNQVLRSPMATGKQELIRNDKLSSLEPTLINLQLNSHHGEGSSIITHNVVLGVKATPSVVPANLMVSNLAEGVNNSRGLFKIIQWTEGTQRFVRDLIFGMKGAREDAVANKDMKHWLRALKNRRYSDVVGKTMSGTGNSPMVTIVTTSYEVAKVAEATGMDLNEEYTAAKLIAKYFLLGFIIYETDSGKLKAMFDGDTKFSVTTISGLKTKQQKDLDLMQYSQFIRAAGRM